MNWYIGQKVVCIQGNSTYDGRQLVKGQEYIIEGVSACKCSTLIYVGQLSKVSTLCQKCNVEMNGGEWWHYERRFAPMHEYKESEKAVKQLLEELDLSVVN